MCGISLVVSSECPSDTVSENRSQGSSVELLKSELLTLLKARGPDAQNAVNYRITAPQQHHPVHQSKNKSNANSLLLWLFGSVLHIQGESITAQPFVDAGGNTLLWNGEVFGQSNEICEYPTLHIQAGESDTVAVARMLALVVDSVAERTDSQHEISAAIAQSLATIHGPYAFIYYHKASNSIHFGRDPFGRRSLVLGCAQPLLSALHSGEGSVDFMLSENQVFALSSVCPPKPVAVLESTVSDSGSVLDTLNTQVDTNTTSTTTTTSTNNTTTTNNTATDTELLWEEVGIAGIYCLYAPHTTHTSNYTHTTETTHINTDSTGSVYSVATSGTSLTIGLTPWPAHRLRVGRTISTTNTITTDTTTSITVNTTTTTNNNITTNTNTSNIANTNTTTTKNTNSNNNVIQDKVSPSTVFLHTLQAAVQRRVYSMPHSVTTTTSNTTSTTPPTTSTTTSTTPPTTSNTTSTTPPTTSNNNSSNSTNNTNNTNSTTDNNSNTTTTTNNTTNTTNNNTTTNSTTTTSYTTNNNSTDNRSRVGALFSGGIDSVLLTALLHHSTAPELSIDLLNVTFIKTQSGNSTITNGTSDVGSPSPDRVAAIAALVELQTIFPSREWRLVHIDVPEEERYAHEQHIKDLIRPSDTHMDLNIGTAFYFASRGKGYLRDYSAAELSALFSATTDMGDDEEGSGNGGNRGSSGDDSISKSSKSNNKGRPLLRHGAAGAAAGVGRVNNTIDTTLTMPTLVEIAPGKYKCHIEVCNRVYKSGCSNYCCKKCCDLVHRTSVLGGDINSESSSDISSGDVYMKNRLRFIELDAQNPCPAHKVKNKQLNKMRSNINAQMSKLNLCDSVVEVEVFVDTEISSFVPDIAHTSDGNDIVTTAPCTTSVDATTTHTTTTTSTFSTTPATVPASITTTTTPVTTTTIPIALLTPYQCQCKALLVGIGADEQMAGYGRHRTVYLKAYKDAQVETSQNNMNSAWCDRVATAALETELNKDLTRLWKRNLGRDDRCISDNGREAWFPFLDENVVALLQSLPMHEICDLSQAQGVGDKQILRDAAKLLGLAQCTELVKRAIQFGTRVAQHTNQHYHGSNRKGKGDTKIEG